VSGGGLSTGTLFDDENRRVRVARAPRDGSVATRSTTDDMRTHATREIDRGGDP